MEPQTQDVPSSRQEMNTVMMARAHAREVHKRCTMDILLKGRSAGHSASSGASSAPGYSNPVVSQVHCVLITILLSVINTVLIFPLVLFVLMFNSQNSEFVFSLNKYLKFKEYERVIILIDIFMNIRKWSRTTLELTSFELMSYYNTYYCILCFHYHLPNIILYWFILVVWKKLSIRKRK